MRANREKQFPSSIVSPATQYFVVNCAIHIEGPGIVKQPIPAPWLKHEAP
jgi:hypothetical protein